MSGRTAVRNALKMYQKCTKMLQKYSKMLRMFRNALKNIKTASVYVFGDTNAQFTLADVHGEQKI